VHQLSGLPKKKRERGFRKRHNKRCEIGYLWGVQKGRKSQGFEEPMLQALPKDLFVGSKGRKGGFADKATGDSWEKMIMFVLYGRTGVLDYRHCDW